jgi:hypothetical protein
MDYPFAESYTFSNVRRVLDEDDFGDGMMKMTVEEFVNLMGSLGFQAKVVIQDKTLADRWSA